MFYILHVLHIIISDWGCMSVGREAVVVSTVQTQYIRSLTQTSKYDFFTYYLVAIATLRRLPKCCLLNSLKMEVPDRTQFSYLSVLLAPLIHTTKLLLARTDNFTGHIYNFGPPTFILCPQKLRHIS